MENFLIVGHRGAAAYAPENTLASLEEAISRHADIIEFDLRKTADGIIVLCHDWGVKTENGQSKSISKITFTELSNILQTQGCQIATFEQVLEQFGERIPLNIEIKVGGFEREIVELLKKYPPKFEPILTSFFPWVITRLRLIDKNIRTALVLGRERVLRLNILARPMVNTLISSLGVVSLHLQEAIISESVVETLKKAGVTIFAWTVDDPDQMRRFISFGIDGIITNKPDILYDVCLELARADRPKLKVNSQKFGHFTYIV